MSLVRPVPELGIALIDWEVWHNTCWITADSQNEVIKETPSCTTAGRKQPPQTGSSFAVGVRSISNPSHGPNPGVHLIWTIKSAFRPLSTILMFRWGLVRPLHGPRLRAPVPSHVWTLHLGGTTAPLMIPSFYTFLQQTAWWSEAGYNNQTNKLQAASLRE